ncbi:hypothetical protein AMBR_DPAELIID_02381 [Lacticaseibacillus rhamnosus]|nr:hypothetical protein AMBR_DPAELIID_02381 [Lacticaseibacillus rhamnosus]
MSTLEKIQALNPDKTIYQLTDSAFSDYGVTYTQYDVSELQQFMDQQVPIPAPTAANRYIPSCLLYTSDAADDTPCVDLGGRRIIKKKKKKQKQKQAITTTKNISTTRQKNNNTTGYKTINTHNATATQEQIHNTHHS